jgi:hypothetical protein
MRTESQSAPQLEVAFWAAVVMGASGSMVGSWLGWPWITVGIPIASVVAYYLRGRRLRLGGISTIEFADSVYYLGFLFTLIALVVSLVVFTSGGDDRSVRTVLPQFGLAIATSVVGLACRISLVSFRPTRQGVIEETEDMLERATQALRTNLESLSVEMMSLKEFTVSSVKHAVEGMTAELAEVVDATRVAIEDAANRLTVSTGRASEHLEATLRDSIESAGGELRRTVAAVTGRTERLFGKIEGAYERFIGRIDATVLPRDALVRGLEEPLAALTGQLRDHAEQVAAIVRAEEAARTHADRLARAAESIAARAETVARSLEPLELAGMPLRRLNAEFRAVIEALQQSVLALTELGRALEAHAEGVTHIASHVQKEAQLAETLREKLERDVAAARDALAVVSQQMVDAVRFIRKNL